MTLRPREYTSTIFSFPSAIPLAYLLEIKFSLVLGTNTSNSYEHVFLCSTPYFKKNLLAGVSLASLSVCDGCQQMRPVTCGVFKQHLRLMKHKLFLFVMVLKRESTFLRSSEKGG